jgi:transposase
MYPLDARNHALGLIADGFSLNQVSKQLGISRAAIREWRDQGPQRFRDLSPCPECDDADLDVPAYVFLLGAYLGHGRIRTTPTGSTRVQITFPAGHAFASEVAVAVAALCPQGRPVDLRSSGSRTHVRQSWTHWPCLLPMKDVAGDPHPLPHWQEQVVAAHPAMLLRGLLQSGRCRTTNWATRAVAGETRRYEYGRWVLTHRSSTVREACGEALDRLGVSWRQPRWNSIAVSNRHDVAKLDETIGVGRAPYPAG